VSAPPIVVVPSSTLPEVLALEACQREFAELEAAHPAVFRKLRELAGRYNATLGGADVAVRARKVSCGPLRITAFTATRSYQALCRILGRKKFVAAGGEIGASAPTYTMNPKAFDALLASGAVEEALAEKLVLYAPRYDKPDPISLP